MFVNKYEVSSTDEFDAWIDGLKDSGTRIAMFKYIDRMADGNFGNSRPVGEGVMERKINAGPGYRLYFMQSAAVCIVLLCGGDKSTQRRDIARAKQLKKEVESWQ
jgi:putative addiction module killer protein